MLIFQFGTGFQQTSIIILGNLIGANDVPLAKKMAFLMLVQVLTILSLISTGIYVFRSEILHLFSTEDENANITMALESMPLMSQINIAIGLNCFLVGCSRALGMQAYGVPIMLLTCLLVQLPVAIFFTLSLQIGIWGLFLASLVTQIFQMVSFGSITVCADWQKIAD